jgi:hypothetical protein
VISCFCVLIGYSPALRRASPHPLDEVLAFDFRKIQIVRSVSSESEILRHRQQLALLLKELEGLAQVRRTVA